MIKKLLIILIFTITFHKTYSQQITLFNSNGAAKAYIDYNEDATIFSWNGKPLAFLENDNNEICVFGFNGRFLGWYVDGIIYDKNGYAVGASKGSVNMLTNIEPIKSIQELRPIKPITPITPIQPILNNSWSSMSLIEFLYSGKY